MSGAVFKFLSYDTAKYDFAGAIAKVLQVEDLSRFHEAYLERKRARGGEAVITYEDNLAERTLLESLKGEAWFVELYRAFAHTVVAPVFGNKVTYTWPPTFRVHMAGSPSVSAWHRDTDVTGRHDLITAWVPFVDTFGTNTIWVETEYGKKDYVPVEVKHGQLLLFDGGYLWHGSVPNTTEVTRISMDFRVAPKRIDLEQPDLGILAVRPQEYRDQLLK